MTQPSPIAAISLWQPWASLLFEPDCKVHETRDWPVPIGFIGNRVLIHAAKKWMATCNFGAILEGVCVRHFGSTWNDKTAGLPRGMFIGIARLTESRLIVNRGGWDSEVDYMAGDWTRDRYAWRMEDRQRLASPIPAIGRQGFWWPELEQADYEKITAWKSQP